MCIFSGLHRLMWDVSTVLKCLVIYKICYKRRSQRLHLTCVINLSFMQFVGDIATIQDLEDHDELEEALQPPLTLRYVFVLLDLLSRSCFSTTRASLSKVVSRMVIPELCNVHEQRMASAILNVKSLQYIYHSITIVCMIWGYLDCKENPFSIIEP